MNGCTHTHRVNRPYLDDETNEMVDNWEAEYTYVDLSLHSYKCTQCGEVFWYSQRGRIAETRGINVHDVTAEMIAEDDAK